MNNFILTVLNGYLEQDIERAHHLKQINGKIIRVVVPEIKLDLLFKVEDKALLSEDESASEDVEIKLAAKVFPELLMGADQDKLIKSGHIQINGDTHIASVLQNTLREIEIDWEELVSKYTGDTVAYRLGKGARAIHAFRKNIHENLRQDVRDYLQDNIQVSATQEEVDEFVEQVDLVRAQLDRLEARLNRLQAHD